MVNARGRSSPVVAAGWGGRIAEFGRAMGYASQQEFGEALGTDGARISNWVNEKVKTIRPSSLQKMARLTTTYDAAYRWLLEGGEMPALRVNAAVNANEVAALQSRVGTVVGEVLGEFWHFALADKPIPWRPVLRALRRVQEAAGLPIPAEEPDADRERDAADG